MSLGRLNARINTSGKTLKTKGLPARGRYGQVWGFPLLRVWLCSTRITPSKIFYFCDGEESCIPIHLSIEENQFIFYSWQRKMCCTKLLWKWTLQKIRIIYLSAMDFSHCTDASSCKSSALLCGFSVFTGSCFKNSGGDYNPLPLHIKLPWKIFPALCILHRCIP